MCLSVHIWENVYLQGLRVLFDLFSLGSMESLPPLSCCSVLSLGRLPSLQLLMRYFPVRLRANAFWRIRWDSNPRLPDLESGTLTTELRIHKKRQGGIAPFPFQLANDCRSDKPRVYLHYCLVPCDSGNSYHRAIQKIRIALPYSRFLCIFLGFIHPSLWYYGLCNQHTCTGFIPQCSVPPRALRK